MGVLAELCRAVGKTPTAIVTDRELALMNAVDDIFPTTKHILCRRHVYKNLDDKAKLKTNNVDEADRFAKACMVVFWSKTES